MAKDKSNTKDIIGVTLGGLSMLGAGILGGMTYNSRKTRLQIDGGEYYSTNKKDPSSVLNVSTKPSKTII
jgi:hypothetical protein